MGYDNEQLLVLEKLATHNGSTIDSLSLLR